MSSPYATKSDQGAFCLGRLLASPQLAWNSPRMPRNVLVGVLCLAAACSVPTSGPDATGATDAGLADVHADRLSIVPGTCVSAADCDDGLLCNGSESCLRGTCAAGIRVDCDDGIACTVDRCDEATIQCEHIPTDLDGDGHADRFCRSADGLALGDDCDDRDPQRFPGNFETCDPLGHDEDCDATTLGMTDNDGDGHIAASCCNFASGLLRCGDDCDDSVAAIRPSASETCNGIDDDCDGLVDDLLGGTVVCTAGESRSCANACGVLGEQRCAADCLGFTECIAPEACNGCDDDRDGATDNGFECAQGRSDACVTSCGTQGTHVCGDVCSFGACTRAEQCNYCDDDGNGDWYDDASLARDVTESGIECDPLNGVNVECTTLVVQDTPGSPVRTVEMLQMTGDALGESSAYWIPIGRMGFGAVEVRVVTYATPLEPDPPPNHWLIGGWSIVLSTDGTPVAGSGQRRGMPDDRHGVAFSWLWYTPRSTCCTPSSAPADGARFFRLEPGMPPMARGLFDGITHYDVSAPPSVRLNSTSGRVRQEMIARYTPDDPATLANEEQVLLQIIDEGGPFHPGGISEHLYVADSDAMLIDPDGDYQVGDPIYLGITAGTYADSYPDGVVGGFPVHVEVELTSTYEITTPEGPVTVRDNVSRVIRHNHCTGL